MTRRGLRVCWVGNGINFHTLDPVRTILNEEEFRDLELVTITDHPDANVPWSLDAVREVVPTCDLAVVPMGDGNAYKVKSSNRVVLFMAAGIPVVAGDLRSYREVIQHGSTGMLAADPEAYRTAFRLLHDPEVRSGIARQAHEYCLENFTLDHIIDRWITFFTSLAAPPVTGAAASDPYRHSLGVLKAHSALRLSAEGWGWDHRVTYTLLREGLGLAVKHPSTLLLEDLVNVPRTAARAVKQQARTTRMVAPTYRFARGCWHALRGLVQAGMPARKRV